MTLFTDTLQFKRPSEAADWFILYERDGILIRMTFACKNTKVPSVRAPRSGSPERTSLHMTDGGSEVQTCNNNNMCP